MTAYALCVVSPLSNNKSALAPLTVWETHMRRRDFFKVVAASASI